MRIERALTVAVCLALSACTNLARLEAQIGAERYATGSISYALVRDQTLVRFEAGNQRGRFRVFDARLAAPCPDIETSTLSVTIATASVDLANPLAEQMLRGAAWFASRDYPLARFDSTDIEADDYPPLIVRGPFTLRGVTREITLEVRFPDGLPDLAAKPDQIAFEAKTSLSRSAFGMDAMPELAGDTVRIEVQGVLQRQAQTPAQAGPPA